MPHSKWYKKVIDANKTKKIAGWPMPEAPTENASGKCPSQVPLHK
jgi:hypothetical protein